MSGGEGGGKRGSRDMQEGRQADALGKTHRQADRQTNRCGMGHV